MEWTFDAKGNMTVKDPEDGGNNTNYSWTEDNRLSQVARQGAGPGGATLTTQFAYDYQGARILRRDNDTARRRYFFNGITEEVVKESASGAASDAAFAFAEKEDGESAADWYVYDNTPSGAAVSAVTDTARHPDGAGKVIKCDGADGNGFAAGDNDAGNFNPNATAWNDTRRVVSMWHKGGFGPAYVKAIVN